MIRADENALICDMAETYHVYDYKKMRPMQAAILACGLPDDSRIKRKLSGQKHTTQTVLLACIADSLRFIAWTKTKDAQKNMNRPKSILEELMTEPEQYASFDSIEAYEAARAKIMES